MFKIIEVRGILLTFLFDIYSMSLKKSFRSIIKMLRCLYIKLKDSQKNRTLKSRKIKNIKKLQKKKKKKNWIILQNKRLMEFLS